MEIFSLFIGGFIGLVIACLIVAILSTIDYILWKEYYNLYKSIYGLYSILTVFPFGFYMYIRLKINKDI